MSNNKIPYEISLWHEVAGGKEEKLAILGGSGLSNFEGAAINGKFIVNINGSHTLTFDIPKFYYDNETGEKTKNEIVNEIWNESKIKLKFENNWYEFFVKDIKESRQGKQLVYNYTCSDSYITELSTQGYELNFDEESGNGTIDELGKKVFENSGWTYKPVKSGTFLETSTEYVKKDGRIEVDSNTNLPKTEEVVKEFPKSIYNEELGRYVNIYTNGAGAEIYSYTATETTTVESVRNLITNSSNFIQTTGWASVDNKPIVFTFEKINDIYYLKCTPSGTGAIKNITTNGISYKFEGGKYYAIRVVTKDPANNLVCKIESQDNTTEYKSVSVNGADYYILKPEKTYYGFNTVLESNFTFYIQSIELFELRAKTSEHSLEELIGSAASFSKAEFTEKFLLSDSEDNIPQAYKSERTYFFKIENDEIIYLSEEEVKDYSAVVSNQKVRTLIKDKSNRFNLSQDLAELFNGWPRFTVEFDENGYLRYDEEGKPLKSVQFVEEIGVPNGAGFHYQINLNNIERNINSDSLVTKMFVEHLETEFSDSGLITIEDAEEEFNPSGENFLINFDYFLKIGKINVFDWVNDLYGTSSGDMAYLTKLRKYNDTYNSNIDLSIELSSTINSLKTSKDGYELQYTTTQQQIDEINTLLTGLITDKDRQTKEELRDRYLAQKTEIAKNIATINSQLEVYQEQFDSIMESNEEILELKKNLNKAFNEKYAKFLREGVWQDDNYTSANDYCLDAQKTLRRSCYPEVSYTMNVVNIAMDKEYEDWKFNVSDYTFATDEEVFGRDATGMLNREPVTLSEIQYDLDSPKDTIITVQNFKTQFEDLFSRIAATSQTVQFKEGMYNKAANNFTNDGQIKVEVLQSTLLNNSLILAQSGDQSVIIDNRGIELNDILSRNKIVRLINNGIFLSNNSGQTWTTGITADGINAAAITTGQIDVDKIIISPYGFPTFRWDKDGISSYRVNDSGGAITVNSNQFVRLDQHGLYLVNKNSEIFKDNDGVSWWEGKTWNERLRIIEDTDNAIVSLTWNGLTIGSDSGALKISTKESNIKISDTEKNERIILGEVGVNTYKTINPDYKVAKYINENGEEVYITATYVHPVTFSSFEDLSEKLEEAAKNRPDGYLYNIGEGYIYRNENEEDLILDNGLILSSEDMLVTISSCLNSESISLKDFAISEFIIVNKEIDYGFLIKNNEKNLVLKTSNKGSLWLQKEILVGGSEDRPLLIIQATPLNSESPVLGAGLKGLLENRKDYNFSVDAEGKLYAKEAEIYGDIYAENGYFKGTIEAVDGAIERKITIGLSGNDDGEYVGNSWISAIEGENALQINGEVFSVSHEGILTAQGAILTNINAVGGTFEGTIKAKDGEITGNLAFGKTSDDFGFFLDGDSSKEYRIRLYKEDKDIFTLKTNGELYAEKLIIGKDGKINKFLMIGDNSAWINTAVDGLKNSNYVFISGHSDIELSSRLNSLLVDDAENINEEIKEKSKFLIDKNGNIIVKGNNNEISGSLSIVNDNEKSGQIKVGNIIITSGKVENDGQALDYGGKIYSGNKWYITDEGSAYFQNAMINGDLHSVRFVYDEVATSSGTIIIRPSCKIENISYDSENEYLKIYLNQKLEDTTTDNYFMIQKITSITSNNTKYYGKIYNTSWEVDGIAEEGKNLIYVKELYSKDFVEDNWLNSKIDIKDLNTSEFINGTFIDFGSIGSTGIVINAMNRPVYGQSESITFYKNIPNSLNNSFSREYSLVLGNLESINSTIDKFMPLSEEEGKLRYGLYSDNVFLKGVMVAIDENNVSAGISTGRELDNKEERIVFWAGQGENEERKNAPFTVTNEGYVRAVNGYFEGTIVTKNAEITGRVTNNGLKVDGQSLGIAFLNSSGKDENGNYQVAPVTSLIDAGGLDLYKNADLRIYKDVSFTDNIFRKEEDNDPWGENFNTKKEYLDSIKAIPYIFSNHNTSSLGATNFATYSILNNMLEGIIIGNNFLSYKTKEINEENNDSSYEGFFNSNFGFTVKFGIDNIKFFNSGLEDKFTLVTNEKIETTRGRFNEVSIDSIKNNNEIVEKARINLEEKVKIQTYYDANNKQNGFDIYIIE